jgi:hypothetical protein
VWVPFASYKATAQYEALEVDRIAITHVSSSAGTTHNTDNSVFAAVAIASNGAVKGQDIFGAGTTSTKDIDLTANKLTVPKDNFVSFQIWAKLSATQTSSSASGIHRSGMNPILGLGSGVVTGEWNPAYFLSANIRATGLSSGERVYASSTSATDGNQMVTRKTRPVVTKQSLSSATLSNQDMDLIKFQVTPDSAGSVALKQMMFSLSKTSALALSNFRVFKGSSDMGQANYAINYTSTTGAATDVENGSIATNQATGFIIVSFTNEESISGSGNVYSLRATVSGAASGQNMSLQFYRDTASSIVTGYLQGTSAFGGVPGSAAIYHIDTAGAPDGVANATGTFLWSDNSEALHSYASSTAGGSRDWTNDVLVEDISWSQALSL